VVEPDTPLHRPASIEDPAAFNPLVFLVLDDLLLELEAHIVLASDDAADVASASPVPGVGSSATPFNEGRCCETVVRTGQCEAQMTETGE